MLHRPGNELKRLTPRNNDKLLFDGIPWVSRAQDEHDAFAQALRDRDVEVLYLTDLLTETLRGRRGPRARHRRCDGEPAPRGHAAQLPHRRPARPEPAGAVRLPHRRRAQRRGAGRSRPGHQPARARRLPHRPAAQPAVHARLERLDPRPGRDHVAGDAGARARDPADRADLHPAPALRRHPEDPRLAARARRGRRRAAPRTGSHRGRRRASAPPRQAPSGWPVRCSAPTSRTPCWPCRSPRSARPCTSTPCARWSTSTRS